VWNEEPPQYFPLRVTGLSPLLLLWLGPVCLLPIALAGPILLPVVAFAFVCAIVGIGLSLVVVRRSPIRATPDAYRLVGDDVVRRVIGRFIAGAGVLLFVAILVLPLPFILLFVAFFVAWYIAGVSIAWILVDRSLARIERERGGRLCMRWQGLVRFLLTVRPELVLLSR
jgi:hypothetical protein